ncbi:MAG: ATP-binding protein [Stenotrophomonas koreensis]|jgi:PAS domain S-box|uniref:hybrid sensor histidine kinase/response regulator n=1 Tax=Stenotrophomonas koreensis TaxID=266128 RepID=UPI0009F99DBC|nr:PAS domain-containing sensor histidine kinase [Stenotrophomonas koreensis]
MPLSLDSKQAEAMSADEADSGWSARILAHGRAGAGVLRRLSDDAFEFVHATPRLARLTRLPVRRGSSLRQLAPWLEQEWYDRLNRIARQGGTGLFESRLGGRTRWFAVEVSALEGPGSPLLGVMLHNITRRKRREQETHEKKQRYRALVDGLPLPVWVIGADGQVQFVNSVFETFFGHPAVSELGLMWSQLLHPEELEGFEYKMQQALAERSELTSVVRGRRADGAWRWLEISVVPRYSRSGRFLGMAGNSRDITDRHELELANEQLLRAERVARTAAESTARLKDEFMATISHELRTPLTTVLGWSEVLLQRIPVDDPNYKGIRVIATSGLALKRLIGDMLDLSGMLLGKLKLDMEVLDLAREVGDAVRSLDLAAAERQLDVRLSLPSGDCPVLGDQTRVQQILWNLLSNAAKFTDEGGVIDIVLDKLGNNYRLRITDSGVGIAEEFLPHIFSRFRQADGTTTRRYGGLGLGLSIVQQLVDLHGGTVTASSPGIGGGATFTVLLPVLPRSGPPVHARPGSQRTRIQAVGTDSDTLANLRLLLVDDQKEIIEMLRQSLERHGAQVHTASSAAEALRMIGGSDHARYDVVLSDIGMPGMDGYAMVRTIREDLGLPASVLPIIAVTALARSDDRQRALENGFQAHVTKPCNLAVLLAEIRTVLRA